MYVIVIEAISDTKGVKPMIDLTVAQKMGLKVNLTADCGEFQTYHKPGSEEKLYMGSVPRPI